MSNYSRTPPPRQLTNQESLETLTHWKDKFKSFYKRDADYKNLIKTTNTWDPSAENYGFVDEPGDGKKADELAEDMVDLLRTLAGYLPHSYLTTRIVEDTKSWEDVWSIIYEHYNVKITSESLLNFESLNKEVGETHRQFYE